MSEVQMFGRFAMTAQACISRLMSEECEVSDLDQFIYTYMDTMVEIDLWIRSLTKSTMDGDGDGDDDGEDNIVEANTRHEPSDQQGIVQKSNKLPVVVESDNAQLQVQPVARKVIKPFPETSKQSSQHLQSQFHLDCLKPGWHTVTLGQPSLTGRVVLRVNGE